MENTAIFVESSQSVDFRSVSGARLLFSPLLEVHGFVAALDQMLRRFVLVPADDTA